MDKKVTLISENVIYEGIINAFQNACSGGARVTSTARILHIMQIQGAMAQKIKKSTEDLKIVCP